MCTFKNLVLDPEPDSAKCLDLKLLAPISLFHYHLPSHPPPCVHSLSLSKATASCPEDQNYMVSAFFPSQSLYHSSSSLIRYAWSLLLNHDAFLLCHPMQITPQVYSQGQYRKKVSLPRPNSWRKSRQKS